MSEVEEFIDEKLAMDEMIGILDHLGLNRPQDKASTHGGEWFMPCPMCALTTGDPGTKRCQFWPSRPYFGRGSKLDPSYWCRDCRSSGDLVGLYAEVFSVTFKEALWHFGITSYKKRDSDETMTFNPRLDSIELPVEDYMTRAWAFVEECMERLWSPEGEMARRYLFGRGFKESTIRELKWGYQDEPRRFDTADEWGMLGKKMRIHKGIVIPEFQIDRQTGAIIVPSIAIRRSEMDMLEEQAETGREQHKYNVIRSGAKGLYHCGLKANLPASLNEGQFNAAIAYQEGRGQFAGAALQSADGCRDNKATTLALMAWPSCWLLNMEADEGGVEAAEHWSNVLENSIVHHPPQGMDLNELYLSGVNVYDFLMAGFELYRRFYGFPSRLNEAEGPLVKEVVQSPSETEQGPSTTTTEPKNVAAAEAQHSEVMDAYHSVESKYSEANQALALTDEYPPSCFDGIASQSRQDEAERALPDEGRQSHQEAKQSPSLPILGPCTRCGEPGCYQDRWGNVWCGADIAAYRLMNDGAHGVLRYCSLYLGEAGEVTLPRRNEAGAWEMVSMPAIVEEVPMGRSRWLEFCQAASYGDIWRAWTEAHQIIVGFEPHEQPAPKPVIKVACARVDCRHDAALAWRRSDERVKDKRGYETNRYRWPLYRPHAVEVSGVVYTFCPRCLTASYLLELVKDLGFPAYHVTSFGDLEGEDEWLSYITTASDFQIVYVFDPLRRANSKMFEKIQSEILV